MISAYLTKLPDFGPTTRVSGQHQWVGDPLMVHKQARQREANRVCSRMKPHWTSGKYRNQINIRMNSSNARLVIYIGCLELNVVVLLVMLSEDILLGCNMKHQGVNPQHYYILASYYKIISDQE